MSLLPPPLCRGYATTCDFSSEAGLEGERFIGQVLTAYANLPFKGSRLVLPDDVVVSEDVWHTTLESELRVLACVGGLPALQQFNLETWLVVKVDREGTKAQQDELRALLRRLDLADEPECAGLPNDITTVMQQPLVEIPVYRSLDLGVDQPADDAQPTQEDDGADRDAPARDDSETTAK